MTDGIPSAYLEGELDGQRQRFMLTQGHVFRIGRSTSNDIPLNDDLASRSHAMLQWAGDGHCYITDLGSRNGTFVNRARISVPVILRHGDSIDVGHQNFTFHQGAPTQYAAFEATDALPSTNILIAQWLITVLVADIRNFTVLSQRIDAKKLSQVTGHLFRESGKSLQAKGAWAQKYIGDAVMAIWRHREGGPVADEIASIFEGLAELSKIAGGLQAQFELDGPVEFGAGINTGLASVGNVGSIACSDHTALGETVNRAFRLQSATRMIGRDVIVGKDTYDQIKRVGPVRVQFEAVMVNLKGYASPVKAYALNFGKLPALVDAFQATPKEHRRRE